MKPAAMEFGEYNIPVNALIHGLAMAPRSRLGARRRVSFATKHDMNAAAEEQCLVQELIAHPVVETPDQVVVDRLAGRDELRNDCVVCAPSQHRVASKLGRRLAKTIFAIERSTGPATPAAVCNEQLVHADPLRFGHTDRSGRTTGQLECNASRKRTAIVDDNGDRCAILRIGNSGP
jgi:hypothetical protein